MFLAGKCEISPSGVLVPAQPPNFDERFRGDSPVYESGPRLVGVEVAIDLPRRDVTDVAVPLRALRCKKVVEDVIAERLAHQVAFLELIERFGEVPRQLVDAEVP